MPAVCKFGGAAGGEETSSSTASVPMEIGALVKGKGKRKGKLKAGIGNGTVPGTGLCFRCGQRGHRPAECEELLQPGQEPGRCDFFDQYLSLYISLSLSL